MAAALEKFTYSFEIIKDGLVKIGEKKGIPVFEFIGEGALKEIRTANYVNTYAWWEQKLDKFVEQTEIEAVPNDWAIMSINIDASYYFFIDGNEIYVGGSITEFKYNVLETKYTGIPKLTNSIVNKEIISYSIEGSPNYIEYKGITKTEQYSFSGDEMEIFAGTKIDGNTLVSSVSVGDQKYIGDTLWRTVSTTKIIYD